MLSCKELFVFFYPMPMFDPRIFYDALPKRRAELIDGKLIVGGSLAKSAMVMASIIRSHGPSVLRELVPEEILSDALIEVYGKERSPTSIADFSPAPNPFPLGRLATEIRLALWNVKELAVLGGGTVVKLGEDAFMPDVYLLRRDRRHTFYNYFLDGAPDLVIEVVTPDLMAHEKEVRLPRFAKAEAPEIWWIDPIAKTFTPHVLDKGVYREANLEGAWYESLAIPGLRIQPDRLFLHDDPWLKVPEDLFDTGILPFTQEQFPSGLGDYPWPKFKFQPRLDLEPVAISFPEYIAGGWELKFEWFDGKAVFGGSHETTLEWLGLLLMTLGVKEGVRCLGKGAKGGLEG